MATPRKVVATYCTCCVCGEICRGEKNVPGVAEQFWLQADGGLSLDVRTITRRRAAWAPSEDYPDHHRPVCNECVDEIAQEDAT